MFSRRSQLCSNPCRIETAPVGKHVALATICGLLVVVAAVWNLSRATASSMTLEGEAVKVRPKEESVPGEILVRFRDQAKAAQSTTALKAVTDMSGRAIPIQLKRLHEGPEIVKGLRLAQVPPQDMAAAITALKTRADVVYAEPNFIRHKTLTPNDPRYSQMWNLNNTAQNTGVAGADIKAEQAWDITTGSRGIVVAVIDEGIDINHQDLQPNIWQNPGEIAGNNVDDDGNGFVDDVNGYDFVHNDGSVYDGPGTNPDDSIVDLHGTHVAGTIGAAGNNGVGVVGVNWQTSLMSLKILGPAGGTSADMIRAFGYAKGMRDRWISSGGTQGANVRITNNSYGGSGYSQAEADAIQSIGTSGVLIVSSAGNDSVDNNVGSAYPANYDLPNVISVAATDRFDNLSSFSNYGSRKVQIAAPGTSIDSTIPGNIYTTLSGTSMAAPHVAGVAALVLAQHPTFSTDRARAAILFGGTAISSLTDRTETGNRLNAAGALQNAMEDDSTAPGPIPDLHVVSTSGRGALLGWTAPGDDGNSGQAMLAEVRFTDQSTGKQFLVGASNCAPGGSPQMLNVNLPYQHTTGTLNLRIFDNAGNTSTANIAVQTDLVAANPYDITESAPEPLSTGGTPLHRNFDDHIDYYSLPFTFPFFDHNVQSVFASGSTSSVFLSTNGALYMARTPIPQEDFESFADRLSGFQMVAGLWDDLDLRTTNRADADIYVVTPDSNRVIFRWQGVPCNLNFSNGQCQGGDPVNFEIEIRSDGTIITRYGDGNTNLHPVVGIGGGDFDPFVIASHTSEGAPRNLTNAQTITYRPRFAPRSADVSASVTAVSPSIVPVGQNATLTITARNIGPAPAVGTRLTGVLPSQLSLISCSAPQGTCWASPSALGTKLTAELGTINAAGSANLTVVVVAASPVNSSRSFSYTTSWNITSATFDPAIPNSSTFSFNGLNPNPIPLTGVLSIGAGSQHGLAIVSGGDVVAWGSNSGLQLGVDNTQFRAIPDTVSGVTGITQVAGGWDHSVALKSDGSVWTWGGNLNGQLGDGTTTNRKTPQPVSGISNVTAIASGTGHIVSLRNDGTVWVWGNNTNGQVGDGTNTNRTSPRQVIALSGVTAIAAGANHTVALKSDGTVWTWGGNDSGQLGDGTNTNRTAPVRVINLSGITAIAAGSHNLALRSDGILWAWGSNNNGQLGDGTTTNRSTPVQVSGVSNVSKVAAGTYHTVYLRADGTVWTWGANFSGQLGDLSDMNFKTTPRQVLWLSGVTSIVSGSEFTLALKSDGKIAAWGNGQVGQLGDGAAFSNRAYYYDVTAPPLPPPPIGIVLTPTFSPDGGSFVSTQNIVVRCLSADAAIDSVIHGGNHSLMLMSDGTIWGGGRNDYGQLGNGSTSGSQPTLVQSNFTGATAVAAGAVHAMALKSDGTVWTWGANTNGQLGLGPNIGNGRAAPGQVTSLANVTAIAAGGGSHSLVLKSNGTVWAWGWNNRGQLGDGTQMDKSSPVQVQGLSNIIAIAAGTQHNLALRADGTVWAWGDNTYGELGDGTSVFLMTTPVQVSGLANVTAIGAGSQFSVALRSDGTVWTWGDNQSGELGIGTTDGLKHPNAVQVNALANVVRITPGYYHMFATLNDGSVLGWGTNFNGQLGTGGSSGSQPTPLLLSAMSGATMFAGGNSSAMRKADSTIWVWGLNQSGQLGLGNTSPRTTPASLPLPATGVVIRYTTNGTDPTASDSIVAAGSTVTVDQTLTLKARAFKAGWTASAVKTANYIIGPAPAPHLFTYASNQVIAIDSVTFVRDPLSVAGLHNFSSDQRTRVIIFTSDLGLNQPTSDLSVTAGGIPLTVEAVGPLTGVPGVSYIIVKLDPTLSGNVAVSITFRGATSNTGTLNLSPLGPN